MLVAHIICTSFLTFNLQGGLNVLVKHDVELVLKRSLNQG